MQTGQVILLSPWKSCFVGWAKMYLRAGLARKLELLPVLKTQVLLFAWVLVLLIGWELWIELGLRFVMVRLKVIG